MRGSDWRFLKNKQANDEEENSMNGLLNKYLPVRNAEGAGSGGGDGGENKGGEGQSQGTAQDTGGKADAGGKANDGGKAGDGGVQPYRVDGIPETMFGSTNEETIDKMAKTINGYRTKEGKKETVKEAAEYVLGEMPDNIKPYLSNLETDPVFATTQAAALKHGLSKDAFAGFVTDVVSEWVEAGILGDVVDVKAERQALLPAESQYLSPDEQSQAINSRMQDNFDWLAKVGPMKGISAEMAEYMQDTLGDRAMGHQVIELVRKMADTRPQPLFGGSGGGGDVRQELSSREQDPRNDPSSPKYDPKFRAATDAMWKDLPD